jgi:hypothetical protein
LRTQTSDVGDGWVRALGDDASRNGKRRHTREVGADDRNSVGVGGGARDRKRRGEGSAGDGANARERDACTLLRGILRFETDD